MHRFLSISLKSIVLFFLLLVIINVSGCLTFRESDKVITEKLEKIKVRYSFHDVVNNDQTIHYWQITNETKPLIMFVHGSPGSSRDLMSIATDSLITKNFMSVLVDRPGFGYSDFGNVEISLARQSELLGSILKSYPNDRKILVGHSLGGPLIVKMAIDFPDQVDALVILAGSVAPELEPEKWFQKPFASKWLRWMVPTALRVSNEEIIPLKKELEKMLPDWNKITVPVFVIHGTEDGLVPKENADFIKKMVVNAPVKITMLEGKSHLFPFTHPHIVVEELMLLK